MARKTPLIQPGSFLGPAPAAEEKPTSLIQEIIREDQERGGRTTTPAATPPIVEEPEEENKQVSLQTSLQENMFTSLLTEALSSPPVELQSFTARVGSSIPLRIQAEVLRRKMRGEKVTAQTLVSAILEAGLAVLEASETEKA